jgi:hypothetical protein
MRVAAKKAKIATLSTGRAIEVLVYEPSATIPGCC